MQKKLLSLAIAGALAVPGAAMADVTSAGSDIKIYGKFHASYDVVDNNAAGGVDDTDDNTAVFRNSRLGLKGKEDLGNGLKAVWQIETHIDTGASAGNSSNVGLRNTYIGLAGDSWGKFFFGKHDTPYKMATAKLDLFSDTIADYNNIIGAHNTASNVIITSDFNERESQVVAYATPKFNGFQAVAARGSVQNMEPAGANDLEAWSFAGMYDQGPFFASAAYEISKGGLNSSTATGDIDAWKIGMGYSFGNSKIGFVYEDIDHEDAANNVMSRDAFWGSFSHKFGANELKIAYGKADDSDVANANDGADNWSIGIDHNFSKRTKVYAIYTRMDNDANAEYGLYAGDNMSNLPAIPNGGTTGANFYTGGNQAGGGDDLDAFSVGIIHKF